MGNESHANRIRNKVQVDGKLGTPDTTEVTILMQDSSKNVLKATGNTVPTADEAGYAKGCIFIKQNAGDGVKAVYQNQGTIADCDFDLIGEITNGELSNLLLEYVDVQLTASEIKNLAGTNIELVPATEAGAGFAIIPISVNLRFTAGTEVLTESDDNLALVYSASTELMEIESTGFIDQATDQNRYQGQAVAVMTPEENVAIDLDNNGDGEIAGNATEDALLDIRVFYRVVPVL